VAHYEWASDRRQTVIKGVSDADCLRQAEADAAKARTNGYAPESQAWADDAGLRVLTVIYRRVGPAQAPASAPTAFALTPKTWAYVAAVGGILVAVAAFLPWITVSAAFVGTVSRNGIDGGGDGFIAVAIGVAIAIAGLSGATNNPGRVRAPLILLGSLALVGAVFEWINVSDRLKTVGTAATLGAVGIGIYAIAIGAVLTIVAGAQLHDD
jgi:hypothetical protein